jgi:alkylation response protein AidB-like acyl-CoA dehydrogenase
MDFTLSEQTLKYKKEAREWVENVLNPLSEPLEKEERFPVELVEALRKGRFFGLTIPKEYGGQGWTAVEWFTVLEELAKAYATVRLIAHTMNGLFWRPLLAFGTEEQKKKYLPKLATGEIWAANSLTEPEAGTGKDINSKATREGDFYLINGRKWLCGNGRGDHVVSGGRALRGVEAGAHAQDDGLYRTAPLQRDL